MNYALKKTLPFANNPPSVTRYHTGSPASAAAPLVEGVGPGAPPGEEDGQAKRLEEFRGDADADGVEGALLREDLGDELGVWVLAGG